MPLNVRRFCTSVFLVLFGLFTITLAQTAAPTSGDVMRDRISKAKAYIAVRNYNAAIYELENIRRESNDQAVQSVVNVLLMNSYLEMSDYKRAQDLLNDFYAAQKTNKPNAQANYFAVAGQVVRGARNRVDRYSALGLNVSDRTLPLEAVNDIEKMRDMLEVVIAQSKDIGKEKNKTSDAMALLEEAATSRSMMARDDYDARRWRDEVGDAREQITNSRSVVLNAVNDTPTATAPATEPIQNAGVAAAPAASGPSPTTVNKPADSTPVFKPVSESSAPKTTTPSDTAIAATSNKLPVSNVAAPGQKPAASDNKDDNRIRFVPNAPAKEDDVRMQRPNPPIKDDEVRMQKPITVAKDDEVRAKAAADETKTAVAEKKNEEGGPLDVGSLIAYATRQTQPVYPPAARSMRTTGVVKVELTVDEDGNVVEVQHTSGPSLLQTAAADAVKRWKFRPFTRDGQPVKATGFVNFNFSL